MSQQSSHTRTCAACRVIDLADGVEDGNLYPVLSARVGHEGRLHRKMKGAQDRAADQVTAFAGSLNFVYLHAFWFGLRTDRGAHRTLPRQRRRAPPGEAASAPAAEPDAGADRDPGAGRWGLGEDGRRSADRVVAG